MATRVQPDYAYAWYNLGVLYDLYMQDLSAALECYRRYLSESAEGEADPAVSRWITDLERRVGAPAQAAQARESR